MRLIEQGSEKVSLYFRANYGAFVMDGKVYEDWDRSGGYAVEKMFKSDPDLQEETGLAKYADIKGLESLYPEYLIKHDEYYSVVWNALVSKDEYEANKEALIESIKEEIMGQSSDGFGEGLSQKPLFKRNLDDVSKESDDFDDGESVYFHMDGSDFFHNEFVVELESAKYVHDDFA